MSAAGIEIIVKSPEGWMLVKRSVMARRAGRTIYGPAVETPIAVEDLPPGREVRIDADLTIWQLAA